MRHLGAFLLLVAMAGPARAQPQGVPVARSPAPPEIDLRAFVETVDRIASDIERADPRRIAPVLLRIPTRLRVKAGAQHFDVPLEPVAQLVADAPRLDPSQWLERRRAIQRQLLVIRSEAVALIDDTPPPAGADPRAALTAILARQEFARAAPADWTARLRSRLTEWLLGLWDRVGGDRLNTRRAAMTLVWLSTLAAIAGLLIWFHRNMRRRMETQQEAAQDASTPASGWALHAITAIRAGRASEAVRFAYHAAITRLAELGVWRVDEARTAREYVTLLAGAGAFDGAFRDIAGQFERVVYANRPATAEDLVRLVDHLETLGCVRPHERAI